MKMSLANSLEMSLFNALPEQGMNWLLLGLDVSLELGLGACDLQGYKQCVRGTRPP